ncbi:MAG TPA: hypothetical protein VFC90_12005 [Planctomycetota bacterium]|nr:hypothetical protein [Planctomycetota bacterium]
MDEEGPAVAPGTKSCPACGGKLVPILYGLPDAEAGRAAERGEIALGGCTLMGDDPKLSCISCGTAFWIAGNDRMGRPSE